VDLDGSEKEDIFARKNLSSYFLLLSYLNGVGVVTVMQQLRFALQIQWHLFRKRAATHLW
jgi:hypothetical protein